MMGVLDFWILRHQI